MRYLKKVIALVAALLVVIPFAPASAEGNFYLSGGSVQVGQTITVALRINPGQAINSVQATISYDGSALQFDSYSGGAFSMCAQQPVSGNATFACAMSGSTSSDSLVGTVTFTALAGSGSTSLGVVNASAANAGTAIPVSTTGSTISFTSPAPAPAPVAPTSPTPTPVRSTTYYHPTYQAPASSSTTSPAPAQPAAATPAAQPAPKVKVSAVKAFANYTSASVSLKLSSPAQVYFNYGTNKDHLVNSTPAVSVSSAKPVPLNASLTPGVRYYYQAIVENNGTVVGKSAVYQFMTKGISLSVAVLDKHYHPLANTSVTLHSTPQTVTTDANGVAKFVNVTPGVHQLIFTSGGHSYRQTVYVADTIHGQGSAQTSSAQSASVVLTAFVQVQRQTPWQLIISVLILLGLVVFFKRRLLKKIFTHFHTYWPKGLNPAS